jgi:hypothetical protein
VILEKGGEVRTVEDNAPSQPMMGDAALAYPGADGIDGDA